MTGMSLNQRIADELGVPEWQVGAAVGLLDGGATVPFVARYRKEATGGLDDVQLRTLQERLDYLRELAERRTAILNSIREQGKLDDALESKIMAVDSKARLEDLYLPFKPKRRTKAQIAREAGLEPLADGLFVDPTQDPQATAAAYVNADNGVPDATAALDGARAILVERFAEDADLIGSLREQMWSRGRLVSRVRDGQQEAGAKFADYFEFSEPFTKLPSHRILALFRGEKEGMLDISPEPEESEEPEASEAPGPSRYERAIAAAVGVEDQGRPADRWLADTVRWAWRTRILLHLGIDLRMRLRQAAEQEAVRVFATNLRDLLLAAPAGARPTMGLDPGYRTGVKVAVIDATGKVVATETIYPHVPQRRWDEALAVLGRLAAEHQVELIAIGNGTASRETDKLAAELVTQPPGCHQGGGVGSGRLGVLRVGLRLPGAARARRVTARRGVDRPPAAGSAGGTRQDRSQVDRRRPVPARSTRKRTVTLAGRGGGGLRQRRRRGRQHSVRAVAAAGIRHHRGACREHRDPPRRAWSVSHPARPGRRSAAGP